jgi:hypothetical protein
VPREHEHFQREVRRRAAEPPGTGTRGRRHDGGGGGGRGGRKGGGARRPTRDASAPAEAPASNPPRKLGSWKPRRRR